jgi:ATP-dependent Clp protease ATP-binding subunit ClpC
VDGPASLGYIGCDEGGRLTEIIVFPKLTRDEIIQIVDLLLQRVREQMTQHEVTIELTEEAKELLVDKGYDPAMGARPLRRAIQRFIEDPLADFVLGRDLTPGSTIVVARKSEEEVDIDVIPPHIPEDVAQVTVPPQEPVSEGEPESG